MRPYIKKTHHIKGLVEWFKWQALSLNSSPQKKKSGIKALLLFDLFCHEFFSMVLGPLCPGLQIPLTGSQGVQPLQDILDDL
jgi:hypothetical protein